MKSCNISKTASSEDQRAFMELKGLKTLSGDSEDMRDPRTRAHKGHTRLRRTSVKIQGAKGALYKPRMCHHERVKNVGEQ